MVAVLLAEFASGVEEATDTVLVKELDVVGRMEAVTVTVPPTGILPRLQVIVPLANAQVPCVAVADKKVTFAGRTFVQMTEVAAAGPLLTTTVENGNVMYSTAEKEVADV